MGDQGSDVDNYTLVSEVVYGDGTGDTRTYLPQETRRYRDENSAASDDVEVTTYEYGFFGGGGDRPDSAIAWRRRSVEAENAGENGPSGTGNTYDRYEIYDESGQVTWQRTADHALTYREYDEVTGRVITAIRNASNSDGDGLPQNHEGLDTTGWSDRTNDGGSLTTEYVRDLQGRVQERVQPGGVTTYTRREMRAFHDRPGLMYYAEVTLPHELLAGSEYGGPARVRWFNAGGDQIGLTEYKVTDAYSINADPDPNEHVIDDYVLDEDNRTRQTAVDHFLSGQIQYRLEWDDIDAGMYFTHEYVYDELGRVERVLQPNGTEHLYSYDIFDRVVQEAVRADQQSWSIVSERYYDHKYDTFGQPVSGVGNGHLTLIRQDVDDQHYRDTELRYDGRGRHVWTIGAEAPHQYREYDNLDRVVAESTYTTAPSSGITPPSVNDRGQHTEIMYSQRGLTYRQRVAIDPSVSNPDYLEANTWYDETGRSIARSGPSGPIVKTEYDGHGRPAAVYQVADEPQSFSDVYDDALHDTKVNNDVVVEERRTRFIDGVGRPDLVSTYRRVHDADDTDTGALSAASAPADLSVVTYQGTEYDSAGRQTVSINFGTNDSSGFVADGAKPTVQNAGEIDQTFDLGTDELVMQTEYDAVGRLGRQIDPENVATAYRYNDRGQRIAVIENDQDDVEISWDATEQRWSVDAGLNPSNPDQNRVTTYVHDSIGNVVKQVAHLPSTGGEDVQVTEYVYGVTKGTNPGDSALASNDLLHQVMYPAGDHQDSDNPVIHSYNRQGELVRLENQAGTVHEYSRDDLGRVVLDRVTSVGAGIDQTIDALDTEYDDLGRPSATRSYSDYGLAGETIENAVGWQYDSLGQVETLTQSAIGDLTANPRTVQYGHAVQQVGSGNVLRQDSLTYPGGQELHYGYSSGGSIDDNISRLSEIQGEDGSMYYDYVGMDMFAVVDYAKPNVQLDRTAYPTGERNAVGHDDHTGEYPGFDRFGRVDRQLWVDGAFQPYDPSESLHSDPSEPHVPPIFQQSFEYDRASNRKDRSNETPTVAWQFLNEEYDYDDLHRLIQSNRGIRDGQSFTHDSDQLSRQWELDMLGNWDKLHEWDPGTSQFDLADDRDHSDANELIAQQTSGQTLTATYDAAGNLRTQEIHDGGQVTTLTYTWDAWNRLVQVKVGSQTRSEFEYNAANWRVVKRADTAEPPDGVLNQERRMYYSLEWQLLEERIDDDVDGAFTAGRTMQYVWGPRYIDDIIKRRQYDSGDPTGEPDDVWYHVTDAQFSTVAVLNDVATLVERVSYDAYGNARHHRMADLTGDGAVGGGDSGLLQSNWNDYGVGDLNRDGFVDAADLGMLNADWDPAEPSGAISTTDNIVGYAGYIFNAEMHGGGLYTVRHRHYSPELGRWLSRDPAEYVDGMSLYEYVRGRPTGLLDKLGLQSRLVHPSDDTLTLECAYTAYYVCRPLAGLASKSGGVHCYVHICPYGQSLGGSDCISYGLLNDDNYVRHHRNDPADRYQEGHEVRGARCIDSPDCFQQTFISTRNKYDGREYTMYDCNSNWFASELWRCCTGSWAPSSPGNWGYPSACTDCPGGVPPIKCASGDFDHYNNCDC